MKLEASPVGDNSGMAHMQNQLVALMIQLAYIKEGERETRIGLVHKIHD